MFLAALILSLFTFFSTGEPAKMEMPSIFSDNMVLQQNTNVPFWGRALPGVDVHIKASWGASAQTIVKEDGSWMLKIKTPKAGGPFTIDLQVGDSTVQYSNVMTGEVWICSGQSNMEMPLQGWPPNDTIINSAEEIRLADYPNLRFATVLRDYSNEKKFNCYTSWVVCTPQTAPVFSASAFFFGKKLYKELNIPIGLIHTSWGGTPVEAWTSAEYLEQFAEYKTIVNDLKESTAEIETFNHWLNEHPVVKPGAPADSNRWKGLDFFDEKCSAVNYEDSSWKEINLPVLWEEAGVGNIDGVIWFRKKITLPQELKNKDLMLELGPIDDMDRTYINGILAGANETDGLWQLNRIYKVPKEAAGDTLLIAVRVMDPQGGGGINGFKEQMKLYSPDSAAVVSLAGTWKYCPAAIYRNNLFYLMDPEKNEYDNRPFVKMDINPVTPTTLFNAMINPLVPYAIKGAIWYQGESNTDKPQLYSGLFTAMINNWRQVWGEGDFPFYYTQIAPYNYGPATHSELLREAQLLTTSVVNTGMAVTMDIGNPLNIHPGNKRDVGERLARIALAKNYKKKIEYSGPVYKSMKIDNDKIILSFDHAKGLNIKPLNGKNNFIIAGNDKVFKEAICEIKGNKLIVFSAEVKNPIAVRYAWTNTEEGTLFNGEGLPASSFRTDNWTEMNISLIH